MDRQSFWEEPEQVEQFAAREPDKRLSSLIASFQHPERTRVLDLGCAGGRNTVFLLERGFDAYAVDTSAAMVAKTRERAAVIVGDEAATMRVRVGAMESLGEFAPESFHVVAALGVYHNATSQHEWDRAIRETVRVMMPGGRLLVASFSPRSDPKGEGLHQLKGKKHMYDGFRSGPLFLLEADEMDLEVAQHGLQPLVPTETVITKTEKGRRVTVNALYRKPAR